MMFSLLKQACSTPSSPAHGFPFNVRKEDKIHVERKTVPGVAWRLIFIPTTTRRRPLIRP